VGFLGNISVRKCISDTFLSNFEAKVSYYDTHGFGYTISTAVGDSQLPVVESLRIEYSDTISRLLSAVLHRIR